MAMDEKVREFRDQHFRRKTKRKVNNSWGVYDIYKFIRKNGWYDIGRPLKEHEFYTIIRGINKLLAENMANGESVTFPEGMGTLELRKFEVGVSIVNGKLKNTYPVDWNKTWQLWYEDEEARKQNILLRNEQKWIYKVKYCVNNATYENKTFYQFTLNRFIKIALKNNIQQGKIDTLW